MIFDKKGKFLASERKISKKQNEYTVVSLLVGADSITVMADCKIDYEFGDDVLFTFDLNTKYNQLKVVNTQIAV